MTTMTRTLLALSLVSFLASLSGAFWGLCLPVGAILFLLFLISKILEKEMSLFDQEERLRVALAQGKTSGPATRTAQTPVRA